MTQNTSPTPTDTRVESILQRAHEMSSTLSQDVMQRRNSINALMENVRNLSQDKDRLTVEAEGLRDERNELERRLGEAVDMIERLQGDLTVRDDRIAQIEGDVARKDEQYARLASEFENTISSFQQGVDSWHREAESIDDVVAMSSRAEFAQLAGNNDFDAIPMIAPRATAPQVTSSERPDESGRVNGIPAFARDTSDEGLDEGEAFRSVREGFGGLLKQAGR